jgi:hypothetical protein
MLVFYWYEAFGNTIVDKIDSLEHYVKRAKIYNKSMESVTSGGVKHRVGMGFGGFLYRGPEHVQKMIDCKNGITRYEVTYAMHNKQMGDEFLRPKRYQSAIAEVI